jgi:hypothetical protein
MTAWTAVRLLGSMGFGDWTTLVFVVGVIGLSAGLQIVAWRRERKTWYGATHTSYGATHTSSGVVRMHEEPPEAPPHQRAA